MSGRNAIPQASRLGGDWRGALSKELKKAVRLFVLGVGNRRKGDDAAGGLCVRLLSKQMVRRKRRADDTPAESASSLRATKKRPPRQLRVFDAGETPESATGLVREFGPTHVLVIDAAVGGHQPGTIFVIDKTNIRQDDISTHRIPLAHLVRYLEQSVGCRVILLGIEPQEVAWGKPMSAAVREAVSVLAAGLADIWTERRHY
jgi:hydrogenase 3 maturation protease